MAKREQVMKIELRRLDEVVPYERNPRLNDMAVGAVAESLRAFGFRQPIVVDADGVIVAGHTRWKAAQKLGLVKVPVHVATDLTDSQIRAYRIADNKSGELAEWDMEILPIELTELNGDFDFESFGFGEKELTQLLEEGGGIQQGLTDPDEIPEPPDEAVTQSGDIWQLGDHRLMCGDSGSESDLGRLLDGQVIDLVLSDPPYNVKVEPRSNNAIAAGLSSFPASGGGHHQKLDVQRHPEKANATHKKLRAKDRPLENDFISDDEFDQLLLDWFGNASRVLKSGGSFYIWGGYANLGNYPKPLVESGLYFSQAVVWDKQHPVLTRKDMMGSFELCFYGWKVGAGHSFYGPNNATDLWHVKKVSPQSMVHLTEKPVELAVRAIQYSSKRGENVLDLFGGSGSTLIGCEQTERKAYLMEFDPLYCDVIVKRWEMFTGKKAVRLERMAGQ
ncbi:Modification methylase DpnIIB [Poriferisphaera corsica]|uniref:site-specific DNA-methyltransferase (adenine-specific) n=1 Tax=Poriferisphaera corsica TaxID=2528020 RepID=A0A517YS52_9BACT|nr:DNA modification methylase [Poriferisphaera corsica]QDU33036.1 Modification methylase DpnIIB [Poriferisphaera corsica]